MRNCIGLICVTASILVCSLTVKAENIRGTPGVDYPNYHSIPTTTFKCSDQKYIPGFYADLETDCQVFHFCYNHRQESFLCPTGTTFNQPILACDLWYSSNCSLAPLYYVVNAGPVIENAGKNMPMLLKLKKRAEDTSNMTLTSKDFDEISSLDESSTDNMQLNSSENTGSETRLNEHNEKDEENGSVSDPEISLDGIHVDTEIESHFDQNANSNAEKEQSAEDLNADRESPGVPNYSEGSSVLAGEQHNPDQSEMDFVYDPVTHGYLGDYDASDNEWQQEFEPNNNFQSFYEYGGKDFNDQMMQDETAQSNEYQNFYEYRSNDYDNQMWQDDELAQLKNNYVDNRYSDIGAKYSEMENERAMGNSEFIEEDKDDTKLFKRYMQIQVPQRMRRRPTYVVMDDKSETEFPELGYRQSLSSEDSQEGFVESISIDSLIEELNTEIPMESEGQNAEDFDSDMQSASEMASSQFSDSSKVEETSNVDSRSLFRDNDQSDSGASNERNKHFQDEDSSAYSGNDFTKYEYQSGFTDSNDTVEEIIEEESEEVQIYDDSDDPVVPDEAAEQILEPEIPENEVDDTYIVIPDETDSQTSFEDIPEPEDIPEETVYDMGRNSMNNWDYAENDESRVNANYDTGYVYEDMNTEEAQSDTPEEIRYVYENAEQKIGDSNEIRYVYEDSNVGDEAGYYDETSYMYENANAGVQTVGSEEMRYMYGDQSIDEEQPHGVESQSSYVYSDLFDRNPQIQTNDHDLSAGTEDREFIPENYYKYVSEDGESLDSHEVQDSYEMTGGVETEDSETAEYDFRRNLPDGSYVPGNVSPHEISRDESYEYVYSQPGMQQGDYLNVDAYSPQFEYPYGNTYERQYPVASEDQSSMYIPENVNSVNEDAESEVQHDQMYSEASQSWNLFSTTEDYATTAHQFEEKSLPFGKDISDDSSKNGASDIDYEDSNFETTENSIESFETDHSEETYYVLDFDERSDEQTGEVSDKYTNYPFVSEDSNTFEEKVPNFQGRVKPVEELGKHSDLNENISSHEMPLSSEITTDGALYDEDALVKSIRSTEPENTDFESDTKEKENGEFSTSELEKSNAMPDRNSKQPLDAWLSATFAGDPDDEKPVTLSSALERLAGLKPTKTQPRQDFVIPTENQFLNTMAFPNTMNFAPYGYGANIGQQFGVMDSSNSVPFSKTENKLSDGISTPNLSKLSKLSSLQDKVRSMKRGKFGMFKKYMKNMKE